MFESRRTQLASLRESLSAARLRVTSITSALGFAPLCPRPMVACSVDPEHRLKEENLPRHTAACRWRQGGYLIDDVPLPGDRGDLGLVITNAEAHCIIQEALRKDPGLKTGPAAVGALNEVSEPETWQRITVDFTPDERRVLYDHVVAVTAPQRAPPPPELAFAGPVPRPAPRYGPTGVEHADSVAARLAAERDSRRRRVSQKKVSTNRKSHLEVLREVIGNQMQLYCDWLGHETAEPTEGSDWSAQPEPNCESANSKAASREVQHARLVEERNNSGASDVRDYQAQVRDHGRVREDRDRGRGDGVKEYASFREDSSQQRVRFREDKNRQRERDDVREDNDRYRERDDVRKEKDRYREREDVREDKDRHRERADIREDKDKYRKRDDVRGEKDRYRERYDVRVDKDRYRERNEDREGKDRYRVRVRGQEDIRSMDDKVGGRDSSREYQARDKESGRSRGERGERNRHMAGFEVLSGVVVKQEQDSDGEVSGRHADEDSAVRVKTERDGSVEDRRGKRKHDQEYDWSDDSVKQAKKKKKKKKKKKHKKHKKKESQSSSASESS